MQLSRTHLISGRFYVLDQDRAKAFCIDKLGFEVRRDARMGQFRWLTVGPKTQPEVNIVVESGALGGGVLATSDCHKTYRELQARGVEFARAPKEMPYGIEAVLRDDSGNFFSPTQRR